MLYDDSDSGFIEKIQKQRRDSEVQMRKTSPVYDQYVDLMRHVYGEPMREAGLDQTQRILVALGMAVYGGKESSIEWCITRALNHGANEAMILDAVDVALLNGGTFTVANVRFAYNALREILAVGSQGSK